MRGEAVLVEDKDAIEVDDKLAVLVEVNEGDAVEVDERLAVVVEVKEGEAVAVREGVFVEVKETEADKEGLAVFEGETVLLADNEVVDVELKLAVLVADAGKDLAGV